MFGSHLACLAVRSRETSSIAAPFLVLYPHDARVKPLPSQGMAPSLAESWNVPRDGIVYEFVLRTGVASTPASQSSPMTRGGGLAAFGPDDDGHQGLHRQGIAETRL
jgi:ABC-type transport system substrate-binding protein